MDKPEQLCVNFPVRIALSLTGRCCSLPISAVISAEEPERVTESSFQVRNFIIDTTSVPVGTQAIGIHWQVAQATSLQAITEIGKSVV